MADPSRKEAGFTLFESLVALAVFSLAAISSLTLITQNVRSAAELEARSFAGYVADNVLIQTELETVINASEQTGESNMGGYAFEWSRTITKLDQGDLQQVKVDVRRSGQKQVIASVTGFRNE